jgi:predicted RecB family endonuclease
VATARELYEAKLLASRYGPVGRVAGNYRTAGFQVKVLSSSEDSPVNFIAWKRGERYAVKVVIRSGPVPKDVVEKLSSEARKQGARPVLVLYGRGPKATGELVEAARSAGVSLRRFRV